MVNTQMSPFFHQGELLLYSVLVGGCLSTAKATGPLSLTPGHSTSFVFQCFGAPSGNGRLHKIAEIEKEMISISHNNPSNFYKDLFLLASPTVQTTMEYS